MAEFLLAIFIVLVTAALVVCVGGLLLSVWMLRRNDRVYAYRMDLISRISYANGADFLSDPDANPLWRWTLFNEVEYDDMMDWKHPFRRLDSYYDIDKFDFPEQVASDARSR